MYGILIRDTAFGVLLEEVMKVIKRDGSTAEFDKKKIVLAIGKANEAVDFEDRVTDAQINDIVEDIASRHRRRVLVEDIQDMVEEKLMELQKYQLMKAYMLYRYERQLVRKANTTDESILSLIKNSNKEVMEENSNKNARTASTQRDLIAGEVSKDLTRRILLPKNISKAHDEGAIHFHDADYFLQPIFNCCLINIKDMLEKGTVMNGKMIESPRSFQTACTVTTQIIASVASSQYGGQSVNIAHLGKYLRRTKEKYIKQCKEQFGDTLDEATQKSFVEMRLKESLKAGVQTIQYQINTLMTTNGQSPFVTLFLYVDEKDEYIEENAMIIEEILKQRYEGIKNEKGVYVTPAFPKLIYVLDENNCLKGGKYDYLTRLAVKCSSKRLYPDYISAKKMRENYEGNVFSPMGCAVLPVYGGNVAGDAHKRVVAAHQSFVAELKSFFKQLPKLLFVAVCQYSALGKIYGNNALVEPALELVIAVFVLPGGQERAAAHGREHALMGVTSDVSPVHWQYGAIARLEPGEKIDKYLLNGYSTISLGYIGLYEVTKLVKGVSHTDPEGTEFALKVMNTLREHCEKWKKETGLGFGLYGTPAESWQTGHSHSLSSFIVISPSKPQTWQ